jgi:hypothetical protein
MSKKKIDGNGFFTFTDCKFFCECVTQYLGREIDPEGKFGIKPNGIYNVYRPKSEIAKKDFIDSLHAKPILDDHTVIGNVGGLKNPDKIHECGVLTDVKLVGNELHGRIDIWSPSMIRKIKGGKRELSLAYACEYMPQKGVFNGEKYDFVQTNLMCGNHLALVDEARNGHDCRVQDGLFARDEKIQLENPNMDLKSLSADELIEGLKGCSDEIVAKVKDFLNTPTDEELKKAEEEKKAAEEKAAKDAEEAKKAEEEAAAKKAEEDAKAAEEAKAKEEADAKAKDEEVKKACDSAVKNIQAAYQFAEKCKSTFGAIAMDGVATVEDVAKKICALDSVPKALKDAASPVDAINVYLSMKTSTVSTDSKPKTTSLESFLGM